MKDNCKKCADVYKLSLSVKLDTEIPKGQEGKKINTGDFSFLWMEHSITAVCFFSLKFQFVTVKTSSH